MEWGGRSAQRMAIPPVRSSHPEGDSDTVDLPTPSVAFTLKDFAWFIGGGIVVSAFISAFLVVAILNLETRVHLWRVERSHAAALQEIQDVGDKWGRTLAALDAKSDTVNRWRRYFPKSMGGTR